MDPKRQRLIVSGGRRKKNINSATVAEGQVPQVEMDASVLELGSAAAFCEDQLDGVADDIELLNLSGRRESQGTSGSESGGEREQSGTNAEDGNENPSGPLQVLQSVTQVNTQLPEKLDENDLNFDAFKNQNSRFSWIECRALLLAVMGTAGRIYRQRRDYEALAQEMRSALFWSSRLPYLDNAKSLHEAYGELLPGDTWRYRGPDSLKRKWSSLVTSLVTQRSRFIRRYKLELAPSHIDLVMLAEECKKLTVKHKEPLVPVPVSRAANILLESGLGGKGNSVRLNLGKKMKN